MSQLTAPLDLDAVLTFMNSVDEELGTDALADPASAAAWLREHGLLPEDAELAAPDLDRATRLRGALRDLADAHHVGEPDPDATARLNEVAAEIPVELRFGDDPGEVALEPAVGGTTAALGAIVGTVAAAVAGDRWRRVKLCRADTCRYAFYDASRNRSGRWCSMAVCGNREKVRAYRERQD